MEDFKVSFELIITIRKVLVSICLKGDKFLLDLISHTGIPGRLIRSNV